MSKKKFNRTKLIGVKCNDPELEKLKRLMEKWQMRDEPKVFRELLRKAKV